MAEEKRTRRQRLIGGLSWFIAAEFFLFAPMKFWPYGVGAYPSYAQKFVNWGYPGWFAMVVGGVEILSAVLLVLPRRRFLGAVLQLFILTGAVTTHIVNRDALGDSVAAPTQLVLAAIVALATWPADWRTPLGWRPPERSA